MRLLYCFLAFFGLSFFACKKVDTPPPFTEDPLFSIMGNLAGEPLNIQAGEDNYYLFSGHQKNAQNIIEYTATFAKLDCLNECQDTFRIKIRGNEIVAQNAGNIDNALFVGNYLYKSNSPVFQIIEDTTYSYSATFDALHKSLAKKKDILDHLAQLAA